MSYNLLNVSMEQMEALVHQASSEMLQTCFLYSFDFGLNIYIYIVDSTVRVLDRSYHVATARIVIRKL